MKNKKKLKLIREKTKVNYSNVIFLKFLFNIYPGAKCIYVYLYKNIINNLNFIIITLIKIDKKKAAML